VAGVTIEIGIADDPDFDFAAWQPFDGAAAFLPPR
jgi:hypothetical protein